MSEDVQERQVRLFELGNRTLSVAWSPDDSQLAVGSDISQVFVLTPEGDVLWTGHSDSEWMWSVAWAPDGQRLATGSGDHVVRFWDAESGELLATGEGHSDSISIVAWSPDGSFLASGSMDRSIRVWDPSTGRMHTELTGHTSLVKGLSWSPHDSRLASASWDDAAAVWDVLSGDQLLRYTEHSRDVNSVAWSSDGGRIASGCDGGSIRIWRSDSGETLQVCEGPRQLVLSIAWSKDDRSVASGGVDGSVRLWSVEDGQELVLVGKHKGTVRWVAFSADGKRLASAGDDGTVAIWDVSDLVSSAVGEPLASATETWLRRQAATLGRVPPTRTSTGSPLLALPLALAPLPAALAACHRLGQFPPVSWLRDLQELIGGGVVEALEAVTAHPGLALLLDLKWPGPARVGLAALLLREVPDGVWEDWKPPAELAPGELREKLTVALTGDEVTSEAPDPPLSHLMKAAAVIDDRLITLLTALGPDAVAADPGLPLRLLREVGSLPKMSESQRRLLGLRVLPANAGVAQGAGQGLDRSGLATRGTIVSLAPSQFCYPLELLSWRHQNGGLLYRARTGREPPSFRPTVLVLDVSPASFGPVEVLTRLAAHALASTLRSLNLPLVLVLAESGGVVYPLEEPADLLRILTLRALAPPDPKAILATAQRLRSQMESGAHEPVVVLLTHAWWGADVASSGTVESLRGLFVQYPGQKIRPPWADRCERWQSLRAGEPGDLSRVLGYLIG